MISIYKHLYQLYKQIYVLLLTFNCPLLSAALYVCMIMLFALIRLEVRAEVSSRSVASPRGSLVDGLSTVHGVSKARSTATVSFSDIISTRFVLR